MRLRNPCSKAALSAATVTLTLIFLLLLVGAAASLGDDKHVEDDETCDEGIDPATEGDSDSSIVDFIDPSILEDDELLDDIRSQLVKGKLVVIRNAFQTEFAEYVQSVLLGNDIDWKHKRNNSLQSLPEQFYQSQLTKDIRGVFNSDKTKNFMTKLVGRDCHGSNPDLTFSEFRPGDHTSLNSDVTNEIARSTTMIWDLSSENWSREFGGAFYWGNARIPDGGYFDPMFNTLLLFNPSETTKYMFTPVLRNAVGRRFAVNAKYTSRDDMSYSVKRPIEEMYGDVASYNLLNSREASWIVHVMDPNDAAEPKRRQKLRDLKTSVRDNYPDPIDDTIFIINDREGGQVEQETAVEQMSKANLTSDSSVLDFLDPTILEDETLLDEISQSLQSGNLVVLRRAFKESFAQYAWSAMNTNNTTWRMGGAFPSFVNKSSEELQSVYGVINHAKTAIFLESLSGRACSRPYTEALFWGKGSHNNPHSDYGPSKRKAQRSLGFLWYLTKDWYPGYGGSLVWHGAKKAREAYVHPEWNTVFLFLPTISSSVHTVTYVEERSNGKLQSIVTWCRADEKDSPVANLDQLVKLAKTGDFAKMSLAQANWLAYEMDTTSMAEDSEIKGLVQNVRRYLDAFDNSAYMIE
mmetsp:Transcript_25870/g.61490  ORF Transcript_25870/g.61490 Transcript_25870/m.61490 type:complete len:635 (+) Transcript_25870:384-2288(+)